MNRIKRDIVVSSILSCIFLVGIAPSNAHEKPSIPSTSQEAIIDVPAANFRILFPKGIQLSEVSSGPHISLETNRGGAFVSVDFNLQYEDIWIQEILFHSLESCKAFEIPYNEIEELDDGFPENWYSSRVFIQEKASFYSSKPSQDLKLMRGVKYFQACEYDVPGGYYLHESTTFIDDTRIKIVIGSDKKCESISRAVDELLAKIKFVKVGKK